MRVIAVEPLFVRGYMTVSCHNATRTTWKSVIFFFPSISSKHHRHHATMWPYHRTITTVTWASGEGDGRRQCFRSKISTEASVRVWWHHGMPRNMRNFPVRVSAILLLPYCLYPTVLSYSCCCCVTSLLLLYFCCRGLSSMTGHM